METEPRRLSAAPGEWQGQWRHPASRHPEPRSRRNPITRRGAARRVVLHVLLGRTTSRARHTGESPLRPGRIWWEDPPASSSCAPPALPRSRDHQSRGIGSRQHLERPRTAHDPTRKSLLAAVRRLRSANERARTSPRTKHTSDMRRPPRLSNARTERESNRPRDGRGRDGVRDRQRRAVARLLACWWRFALCGIGPGSA